MNQFHVNNVELFYEPRNSILPLLTKISNEPEMSQFESAFLCGLLKKYHPKKVLEVGIAGGGTTAIILQCMRLINNVNFQMHSIDYSERFYRDKTFQSGVLGAEAVDMLKATGFHDFEHNFHLGNVACSYMDKIGDGIDFLILDTMHIMPGEVLDFISLLPYLKDGAIVVLHDTALNQYTAVARYCFATGVLFANVVAEKYINLDESKKGGKHYPNIAGFMVNQSTRENIINAFLSLILTWEYVPEKKQLKEYEAAIKAQYDRKYVDIFSAAVELNSSTRKLDYKGRIRRMGRILIRGY